MAKRFEWSDHECNRFCKVHYYFDFEYDSHMPLPHAWNIKTQAGWLHQTVFCGPPAWLPRKPQPLELEGMAMVCPHDPPQLTCNTCRRHEFRAIPV